MKHALSVLTLVAAASSTTFSAYAEPLSLSASRWAAHEQIPGTLPTPTPRAQALVSGSGAIIYGEDDRKDLYEVSDVRVARLAEASVALYSDGFVRFEDPDDSSAKVDLGTISYAKKYGVCPEEKFHDQSTGPFCSGALVGDGLVLTAGHCVPSLQACKSTYFVFGHAVSQAGVPAPTQVPARDVAGCLAIRAYHEDNSGADYALVELDRSTRGRTPLAVDRGDDLAPGTPVAVLGYPSGLPLKIESGARVTAVPSEDYFVLDADIFGGSSGSPVINLETLEVEGVIVRSDGVHPDFIEKPGASCRVAFHCRADSGCGGVQATRARAFAEDLP